MTKKFIAFLVLAVMAISSFSVFASFPDMEDTSWDWARSAVDEMVEYGIIRGYSDNTFRPGNDITKGEAMVLFSRVVGYTGEGNEEFVEFAKEAYADKMKGLSTPYTGEISYLIYKGILSEKTFLTYAADGVVETPLKRYEAAEFLAKIATSNTPLTGTVSQLSFSDIDQINSTMAPYIKYVSENGIMLGMGDGTFNPGGSVTRAQMTVMLSRIIPAIAYEYTDGSIKFYNEATDSLIISLKSGDETEIPLSAEALIKLDGIDVDASTLLAGSKVRVTTSNGELIAVETVSPDYDAVINGRFKRIESIGENKNGIVVLDPTTGLTSTYELSKTVNIVKDDKKLTAVELRNDDYIILTIKEGIVTSIVAESKEAEIKGKVVDIEFLPTFKMTILANNKNTTYEVATNVKVTRNKKDAALENVLVGDSVTITTTYGVISEIVATSKISATEGSITEVIISVDPAITVTDAAGNEYTYAVKRNCKILSGKTEKSFYDLRVGDKVELELDAATVTKITISAAFAGGVEEGTSTTISGVVESVNISYGYIKLVDSTDLIFFSKATLQDTTGKAITAKSITEGSFITVFGTAENGSYTASMVVVQK